jgi:hypothetical protein
LTNVDEEHGDTKTTENGIVALLLLGPEFVAGTFGFGKREATAVRAEDKQVGRLGAMFGTNRFKFRKRLSFTPPLLRILGNRRKLLQRGLQVFRDLGGNDLRRGQVRGIFQQLILELENVQVHLVALGNRADASVA